MPVPQWDKYQEDRWDRDLTGFCREHGQHTDRYGDCPVCISLDDPRKEEDMRGKSFNRKLREFEDDSFRHYYEEKELDPRGETEEEYLEYRAREKRKYELSEM